MKLVKTTNATYQIRKLEEKNAPVMLKRFREDGAFAVIEGENMRSTITYYNADGSLYGKVDTVAPVDYNTKEITRNGYRYNKQPKVEVVPEKADKEDVETENAQENKDDFIDSLINILDSYKGKIGTDKNPVVLERAKRNIERVIKENLDNLI